MPAKTKPSRSNRTVFIVVGVIVALALALGGWYFCNKTQSQQNNNTTDVTQNKPIDSDVDTPNEVPQDDIVRAGDTFKIPELGIQFVLPEGLEGLEYEMIYDNNTNKVASFSSRSLIKADSRCNPKNGTPLGAITSMPDTTDPKELLGPYVTLSDENFKHINGRYVILQAPQSGCSDRTDALDLQTKQGHLLWSIFKTVTPIENRG